jgi:hypothetical protein
MILVSLLCDFRVTNLCVRSFVNFFQAVSSALRLCLAYFFICAPPARLCNILVIFRTRRCFRRAPCRSVIISLCVCASTLTFVTNEVWHNWDLMDSMPWSKWRFRIQSEPHPHTSPRTFVNLRHLPVASSFPDIFDFHGFPDLNSRLHMFAATCVACWIYQFHCVELVEQIWYVVPAIFL